MYMAPDSWKGLYESTLREAKDGTIGAERLDDAVRRILRVKYKLGLFDTDHVDRGDVAAVGAPDHLAVAREAVRSEEHTSELQSLMRISYAVFCLKIKKNNSDEYRHSPHYSNIHQ